jgi:hypothetical protein
MFNHKEAEKKMPNDVTDKMVAAPSMQQGLSLLPSKEELEIMRETANLFIQAGFLPKHLDTPEKVIVTMMVAREIGVPMHYGLSKLYPVDGKVSMQGELMLALVKRSGLYGYRFLKATEDECVFEIWPREHPDEKYTASATMAFAKSHKWDFQEWWNKNAGRMEGKQKQPWAKFPAHMLKWRCVSDAVRVVCPEIIAGMYTPEELGADVTVADDGSVDVMDPDRVSVTVDASDGSTPQSGATHPKAAGKGSGTRAKPATAKPEPAPAPEEPEYDAETGEIIEGDFEPEGDAGTVQRLDPPPGGATTMSLDDEDDDDDEAADAVVAPTPPEPAEKPKARPKAKPAVAPPPPPEDPPAPLGDPFPDEEPEAEAVVAADQLAYNPDGSPANEATRLWEKQNAPAEADDDEDTPVPGAVTDEEKKYYDNAGALRAFLASQKIKGHDKFKANVGYEEIEWKDLDEDQRVIIYIAARDGME